MTKPAILLIAIFLACFIDISKARSGALLFDDEDILSNFWERTFIMLKPDAVQRGLIGEIIKRFEQKGFKLVAMKMMHVSSTKLLKFCGRYTYVLTSS